MKSLAPSCIAAAVTCAICPFVLSSYFSAIAAAQDAPAVRVDESEATRDISALIEGIRAKHKTPALAAAMVRGNELVALGSSGLRKVRAETTVTADDLFHVGSCTKSMTATVAAMLVEDGVIRWDTTVAESLPDLAPNMHEQYREVTLRMLLAHRSGLPEDRSPEPKMWQRVRSLKGPLHQQRIDTAAIVLAGEPAAKRGDAMNYSNFGYIIAGAMMEEATGVTWEELVRTRLFEPLGMVNAGFGPPGGEDNVDRDAPSQPWGHVGDINRLATIQPGPFADNPPLLGPAGTVHCSMADFARYASFHLTRGKGTDLLTPESFDTLREPAFGGDYALGWVVAERDWARGKVLMHDGSNGMWYAVMWIAPEINMAFVAATNVAGAHGAAATDEAVSSMIIQLASEAGTDDDQ